jgi:AraC family transcriptional activator FtrA
MSTNIEIMPNASRQSPPDPNPLVVVLAYDGLCTFEFGVAVEVFGLERPEMGPGWYRCAVAAVEPGPLRAAGGVRIVADGGLDLVAAAGTVVVPGWRRGPAPHGLLDALRAAHARGARLLSICSGAFLVAATGLLDGRRATTHWRYADALSAEHPAIEVVRDVLYVDEGDLLTSAGSAAGIDLCLHLVRLDYGASAANTVARRLVVAAHRDGGQAQFIERPVPRAHEAGRFGQVLDGIRQRLGERLTIAGLAARAGMSERTFVRRFKEATGLAPGEWIIRERVACARDLLEASDVPVEEVARLSGFGSPAGLRHHFGGQVGIPPSLYRRRFGRTAA